MPFSAAVLSQSASVLRHSVSAAYALPEIYARWRAIGWDLFCNGKDRHRRDRTREPLLQGAEHLEQNYRPPHPYLGKPQLTFVSKCGGR